MIAPLTKRQREILDFLATSIGKNGYAPSLAEIGEQFQLTSLATVHKHVANLERKGFIRHGWNRSRSIEIIVGRGVGFCPTCGHQLNAVVEGVTGMTGVKELRQLFAYALKAEK